MKWAKEIKENIQKEIEEAQIKIEQYYNDIKKYEDEIKINNAYLKLVDQLIGE